MQGKESKGIPNEKLFESCNAMKILNFVMKVQVINDVQIEHKFKKWACNFNEIGIMAKRNVGNQKSK